MLHISWQKCKNCCVCGGMEHTGLDLKNAPTYRILKLTSYGISTSYNDFWIDYYWNYIMHWVWIKIYWITFHNYHRPLHTWRASSYSNLHEAWRNLFMIWISNESFIDGWTLHYCRLGQCEVILYECLKNLFHIWLSPAKSVCMRMTIILIF